MKELLDFILSKKMLKAVIGVGITWVLILSFTWLGLNLNSRPWSERTVPLVEGLMKDSAIQVLDDLDLKPIHLDSVYNASAIPGSILEQSPAAGGMVKSGRPVYLTTFRVTPPDEKIGVEEGQDARLAQSLLERKGFVITIKTEANTELNGKVVRVEHRGISLASDERKQRGTSLTLVIGKVLDKNVRIPWLIGLSLSDATQRLSNSSLSVGYVEYGDSLFTRKDTLRALVVSQFPKSSAGFAKAGTAIDLFLEKP
jgi:beta-lactam-binding protein with PASTA domain